MKQSHQGRQYLLETITISHLMMLLDNYDIDNVVHPMMIAIEFVDKSKSQKAGDHDELPKSASTPDQNHFRFHSFQYSIPLWIPFISIVDTISDRVYSKNISDSVCKGTSVA